MGYSICNLYFESSSAREARLWGGHQIEDFLYVSSIIVQRGKTEGKTEQRRNDVLDGRPLSVYKLVLNYDF